MLTPERREHIPGPTGRYSRMRRRRVTLVHVAFLPERATLSRRDAGEGRASVSDTTDLDQGSRLMALAEQVGEQAGGARRDRGRCRVVGWRADLGGAAVGRRRLALLQGRRRGLHQRRQDVVLADRREDRHRAARLHRGPRAGAGARHHERDGRHLGPRRDRRHRPDRQPLRRCARATPASASSGRHAARAERADTIETGHGDRADEHGDVRLGGAVAAERHDRAGRGPSRGAEAHARSHRSGGA